MPATERVHCRIPLDCAGLRLDQALARLLPQYSRARLQQWIRAGKLRLQGTPARPRDRVLGGEVVEGEWEPEDETLDRPQPIPLRIVFEDRELLVLDKPAGLVVHPAAGNPDGTLLNALLHHAPELARLPRAGLVHRLDKDTSGLLVVARSEGAHASLVNQLQARSMGREYEAVVWGRVSGGGSVDAAVGRHPVERKRMAVVAGGKPALTHYRVTARYRGHTRLRLRLESGRTHQIRVHMAHIHHPLLGDPVYGGRARLPAGLGEAARCVVQAFRRQALHAVRLRLVHPASGETLSWEAPLPADMAHLVQALGRDAED